MPPRQIEDQFLAAYVADMERDRVRPLVEYQAMFPGHEATIAREYRLLEEDELGDSAAGAETTEPQRTIGRYRIHRELGRGGQARVYLAHDPRLGRDVALKVLETSRFGLDVEARIQRFRREAELAARLDHPGICGVLDVGEDKAAGVVFLAMRYIEGQTLAHRIAADAGQHSSPKAVSLPPSTDSDISSGSREDRFAPKETTGAQSIRRVLEVVEKVARALHVAHEQRLVHRDVKPGNIMIHAAGEPVVLDFGLARDEGSEALGLTVSGDLLGTPYYMSPEQVRGQHRSIDRRTDIYSLGVTLYECLTLRRPFQASRPEELYQQIIGETLPDPTRLNRNIPRDLKIVLETALEKDPERRYPNALAFADDLRRVRHFEPITARALPVSLRLRRWVQRNPTVATFLGVLLVGLVVTSLLLQAVQARNVELEKVAVAAALGRVAESIDDGSWRQESSRATWLEDIPQRHRGFAWRWLNARRASPKITSIPTEGKVRSLAFAADGKSLLAIVRPVRDDSTVAQRDPDPVAPGELCVLSKKTGAWSLETKTLPAFTVALSPDQKLVVIGDQQGIQLLDPGNYQPLVVHGGRQGAQVTALCWSPDSKRVVAAGRDGSIKVWRIDPAKAASDLVLVDVTPRGLPGFHARIRAVDFHPDGKLLLIAGDRNNAWIVDTVRGGDPREIGFFNSFEKKVLKDEVSYPSRIRAARFSPDGEHFVLAGRFGRVTLYSIHGDVPPVELHEHRADGVASDMNAFDARFDPTGRFVLSCGADWLVQVHDVKSKKRLGYTRIADWPLSLAIDQGGTRVAVASGNRSVSIWSLGSLPLPVELIGHNWLGIRQVLTTAGGRYAFSVGGRSVCKFDLDSGRLLFAIRDLLREPQCIALRKGEQELAIGYMSGHLEIVDAITGDPISKAPYRAPRERVWSELRHAPTGFYALCYSPDGKWLVGGLGTTQPQRDLRREVPVLVLEADSEKLTPVATLSGHLGSVERLYFSGDGSRLVSACQGGKLIFWDTASPVPAGWRAIPGLNQDRGSQDVMFKFAADANGYLYRPGGEMLTPFDIRSGEELEPIPWSLATFGSGWGFVQDLEFLPKGKELLVATTNGLAVWDVPPQNPLLTLPVYHRIESARSVAHYVGAAGREGILAGGGTGSLYFDELEPRPELFRQRQIEWSAGQLVQRKLAVASVAQARAAIQNTTGVPREVRDAALRILDVTSEDPGWFIRGGFFMTLLEPGHDKAVYRTARDAVHELGKPNDRTASLAWVYPMMLGLADYRLGNDAAAIENLSLAATFEKDPYPDVAQPAAVADFQSFAWNFLAMAQYRAGDKEAAQESRKRAVSAGIGGMFDQQAEAQVPAVLKKK